MASQALTPENSVNHRATALSFKAMEDVFDISYKTSIAYQPFTDREIKNPNLEALANHVDENNNPASKFPYLSEGREFYVITHNMVKEWLENAGKEASDWYAKEFYEAMRLTSEGQEYELPEYSHDNMVDLISTVIFGVTAYHELIGHVPDYCDSPFKAGFRAQKCPHSGGFSIILPHGCHRSCYIFSSSPIIGRISELYWRGRCARVGEMCMDKLH